MSNIEIKEECNPPWNFSWIIKDKIAGMACPRSAANLRYVYNKGIRHLVTLSSDHRPAGFTIPGLKKYEIAIEEFEAPTLRQMKQFIEICIEAETKKEGIGVHCRQGQGRTGVMLACYLVHFHDITPNRAISDVRSKRPYSIETYEQERAVFAYHDYLRSI